MQEDKKDNQNYLVALAILGLLGVSGVSLNKVLKKSEEILPQKKGLFIKEENREAITEIINKKASKNYVIDENGFLKESDSKIKKDGDEAFTQMIDQIINGDKRVVIGFDDKIRTLDSEDNVKEEDVFNLTGIKD